jgi:hypothetical protein
VEDGVVLEFGGEVGVHEEESQACAGLGVEGGLVLCGVHFVERAPRSTWASLVDGGEVGSGAARISAGVGQAITEGVQAVEGVLVVGCGEAVPCCPSSGNGVDGGCEGGRAEE